MKTLVFGWLQNHTPSVEGLARAGFSHELQISAQGLDKRFTEKACELMKGVLEAALSELLKPTETLHYPLFQRFNAIYLHDCSTLKLPDACLPLWQGVGGDASPSALKLDASLELLTGMVDSKLLQGKDSDNRSPHATASYPQNTLRVQDLGYFNLARMREQDERGEYWLSRLQPRTVIYQDHQVIDLTSYLTHQAKQGLSQVELSVKLGSKEKLPVRLLAQKLPEHIAAQRKRTLKKAAQKKNRPVNPDSLRLANWQILITNAPTDKLSPNDCFLLYSLRWQIELLFKLWKSHAKLKHSVSANPWRQLCEIYAKLLGIVISHWLILTGLWHRPEHSLVKAHQMIREQSARLALCLNDLNALTAVLEEISQRFEYGCSLNSRKKQPNSCQQLKMGCQFA